MPATPTPRDRLSALIRAVGIRETARRSGINESNVHSLAAGTRDPQLSTVEAILSAVGASWADLDAAPTAQARCKKSG